MDISDEGVDCRKHPTHYALHTQTAGNRRKGWSETMVKQVIETEAGFKILNLSSMCAYGLFDSREEAEQAIAESARADVLARAEAA